MTPLDPSVPPVAVGLIGAGGMGTFHGESLAWRVPTTRLVAVADPAPGVADGLAAAVGCEVTYDNAADLIADDRVEAVVVAAPARAHADLVVAAAGAGKAVFCEKPMAVTLDDARRAVTAAADVVLQVGFQRRFDRSVRAAHDLIVAGRIGTPQLMRSLTRDPGIADPGAVPPSTIFLETLIHDFDVLRYLNPGSRVVSVHAVADTLAYPDYADRGLQDTAMVMVRFDNGAIATAEASFNAVYGYDVRSEVFGSDGLVTAGDTRRTTAMYHGAQGAIAPTWQHHTDLFHDAYVAELRAFATCVRTGAAALPSGEDAEAAVAVAVAAMRSADEHRPIHLDEISG